MLEQILQLACGAVHAQVVVHLVDVVNRGGELRSLWLLPRSALLLVVRSDTPLLQVAYQILH